jgi:hypothetical protein
MRRINERSGRVLLACLLSSVMPLSAADNPVDGIAEPPAAKTVAPQPASEIEQLKQMLADQQRQISDLRLALALQQNKETAASVTASAGSSVIPQVDPTPVSTFRNLGQVASTTAILPHSATLPVARALPAIPLPQAAPNATGSAKNPCEADPERTIPTFLRLGNVCIVPIGFMDLTPFWRDKNAASSMGSNFGSVPYNNVVNGNLSEFHFSEQNSRLGFRVDGDWKGTHFIGYNEFDFNGTSGSTNLAVSNGAIVPRLRLYWVNARKGKVEFLAGQSWSMLTPNRNGISALPGDLFYTQVIDINYMAGLTWTRQPGLRVLVHPDKHVTFGFAAEQADQYIGGSAGGSPIVLPTNLSTLISTQLDGGQNVTLASYLGQPAYTPDFIAKLALDFSRVHFEVAGLESNFKTTALGAPFTTHTKVGAGLQFGFNVALTKNFRLISTNFLSDGGGRYLFGQAPDVIVRADGSLSTVKADGTVDGFEARVKNTLLYAYYGGIYIGRNVAIDTTGKPIGYGFTGSANNQNRAINEFTFGFNQTMWASPRYGAINVMGQYEYLMRSPWFVAAGAPKTAHDNTIYFNIRYTLPGGMPSF